MRNAASLERMALERDRRITEVVEREQSRLRHFIRRRVPDARDAEDILQDVLYELVEANRLLMPIEHVTGWLFRVARNRITDFFRRKKPESFSDAAALDGENESLQWEELLPSADAGPEALYARNVLLHELERLQYVRATDRDLEEARAGAIAFLESPSTEGWFLSLGIPERRQEGMDTLTAVVGAARIRLQPILMTSLATVVGLLPMAIHLHPGDEMNLPLARAVIGGLATSTLLTLFVVPILYVMLKPAGAALPQPHE